MTLWTDAVSPLRDEAGYTFDGAIEVSLRRELALVARRLELARRERKAWEYRWRFDMTYMTGIELVLRERLAARNLPH